MEVPVRSIRTGAALAALMLAAAVAAPSAGAFDELSKTGSTGEYTVSDDGSSPGAICRYESHPGPNYKDELNKVSSRRVWTHGPFPVDSWVGHRIVVLKNAKPYDDEQFRAVWKSPIVKKRANDAEVAFFGGKHYLTPENNKGQYRVQHVFFYYQKQNKNKLIGRVQGLLEVYKLKQSGSPATTFGVEGGPAGYCTQHFHVLN
jgi:hypothetical protein